MTLFPNNPSLDDVGRALGINKFRLLRHFKRELGTTPHAYLIQIRVEQARGFLERGSALLMSPLLSDSPIKPTLLDRSSGSSG